MEALLQEGTLALVKINEYDSILISERWGFNVDEATREVCYCGICHSGMERFTRNSISVIYCKRCGLRINFPSDVMSLDEFLANILFADVEVRRGICPRCFGAKKIHVVGESHGLKISEAFNCPKCQQ